jgi:hypothetical protein
MGASLAVISLSALPARAQNLVTNPGFETGDLTGYTFTGPVGTDSTAHTGNFAAEFNGVETFGDLTQNITTVAGNSYLITFFLQNSAGPNNEFKASFAGSLGVDVLNAAAFGYTQYSFTEVATSTTSVLEFDAFQDPSRFHLDDISVTPAPEPTQYIAMGLGMIGLCALALTARKRIRSA